MPIARAARTIAAPASAVWAALDDFGGIHRFHPEVRHSASTNHLATGLGAERTCEFDKGAIFERIVGYEPGRQMRVEIIETGPFPLKDAFATLTVEPLDGGDSRIKMVMDFTPAFGLLGRLMAPLMVSQFTSLLGRVLAGLDALVTTGQETGAPGALATPA